MTWKGAGNNTVVTKSMREGGDLLIRLRGSPKPTDITRVTLRLRGGACHFGQGGTFSKMKPTCLARVFLVLYDGIVQYCSDSHRNVHKTETACCLLPKTLCSRLLLPRNAAMSLEVPAFKGPHPTICVLADKTLPLHSFSQVQRLARLANPLLCISLPIPS